MTRVPLIGFPLNCERNGSKAMGVRRVALSGFRMVVLASAAMAVFALQPAAAAEKKHQPTAQEPGFFESIGGWFSRQADTFKSSFGGARSTVEEFGHEAGMAARKTVGGATDAAKDAAAVVGRLPSAGVISGYEKCRIAPNGAPDCGSAADALCRAKGYKSGSSIDMTTAEVCPPKVLLAGRTSGPGCHTETFVSSALCR